MTPADALAFVEHHGLVLEAAHHPRIPTLADAIAGETLHGSWWAHAQGRRIFAATRAVRAAPQVLVCRLVDDKITFVHARCWPALARLAAHLPARALARVCETHGADGRHRTERIAFPHWLDASAAALAAGLTESDARARLAALFPPSETGA